MSRRPAAAERGTFTANGMPGHVVALDGSYKSGGGRPMGGGGEILPGHRLVGVVLEGPEGSLFFKLTGRDKLKLKPDPDAKSYWHVRTEQRTPASYLRPY